MKALKLFYWQARLNWYRADCNSMAMGGGLVHRERMAMDPRYRASYNKYEQALGMVHYLKGTEPSMKG